MTGLTQRQAEVLNFMIECVIKRHTHATTSDIMETFKLNSRNAANTHIQALMTKGYLERVGKSFDSDRSTWKILRDPAGRRIQFGLYIESEKP